MKTFDLEDRSFDFAVQIILVMESLTKQKFDLIFVLYFLAFLNNVLLGP